MQHKQKYIREILYSKSHNKGCWMLIEMWIKEQGIGRERMRVVVIFCWVAKEGYSDKKKIT